MANEINTFAIVKYHNLQYPNESIIFRISVVTATNRVSGSRFSLTNGLSAWTRGVKNILDILIGLPLMHNPQLERKLHNERSR